MRAFRAAGHRDIAARDGNVRVCEMVAVHEQHWKRQIGPPVRRVNLIDAGNSAGDAEAVGLRLLPRRMRPARKSLEAQTARMRAWQFLSGKIEDSVEARGRGTRYRAAAQY